MFTKAWKKPNPEAGVDLFTLSLQIISYYTFFFPYAEFFSCRKNKLLNIVLLPVMFLLENI